MPTFTPLRGSSSFLEVRRIIYIFFFVAQSYLRFVISDISSQTSHTGLTLATVCVFTRSVFRAAELSGGFAGHLANNEVSFMILDGAMIMIACGALTLLHPGYSFTRAGWAAAAYPFFNKSAEKIARDQARDERREARQQAILDAKEKRFNRGTRAVPASVEESGENTVQASDGSLKGSKEISSTIDEIQEAPHTREKVQGL